MASSLCSKIRGAASQTWKIMKCQKFSVHHMNSENFVVRCATSLDDLKWIVKQSSDSEKDRVRSAREADCYFTACLTHDFFIGELNGMQISCVSFVRHGEFLIFGGYYFVNSAFRRRGYGVKTVQAVLSDDVFDKSNIHIYASPSLENYYNQKFGLVPNWSTSQYQLTISVVQQRLSSCQLPPSSAKILPANQANFVEMAEYSSDMMGSSQVCKSMLAAMLVHAQESSWVAIGNKGEIVGYLIMNRTSRFPEGGYLIGPLFADSASIARILLKAAAEFAAQDPRNPRFLSLDVSISNQECVNIMEHELGAKRIVSSLLMSSKKGIFRSHEKIFSLASEFVL